ncbi:hypothetical protein [Candidatus Ruminimicrobium bovinum]|uniref:hypothetical protein n=1 Tax=Candidatus Ruminimicrobium bovinum TaxID=3242779 RepID=UPI0039B976C8
MLKYLICSLAMFFSFCSCAPSFPKETLVQDIEKIIEKESGILPKVEIIKDTLYLDLEMEDIVSLQSEVVSKAISSLQSAVFAITRVALSSDADIKIIVVTAYDPNFQVALRMFQNIDDVKSYFYQRISRGDYEQRQLIEMENPETARDAVLDKHYITMDEFVSRLVISQLNMSGRTNPFIANLLTTLNLKYYYINSGVVYLHSSGDGEILSSKFIKQIITSEFKKNIEKYKIETMKSAVILDKENNSVLELDLK